VGLKHRLCAVQMTIACPHCGHELTRPGSWFQSQSHFTCDCCFETSRLTYADKVALFARYEDQTDTGAPPAS